MLVHETDHHADISLFNPDALLQKRADVVGDHFLHINKSSGGDKNCSDNHHQQHKLTQAPGERSFLSRWGRSRSVTHSAPPGFGINAKQWQRRPAAGGIPPRRANLNSKKRQLSFLNLSKSLMLLRFNPSAVHIFVVRFSYANSCNSIRLPLFAPSPEKLLPPKPPISPIFR